MNLQKRLAAQVLGCSPKRILFDENNLDAIKEAITKADVRRLIGQGSIIVLPKRGVSRSRAKERQDQKQKGRRRGQGSRKGMASAREDPKQSWMNRVRLQRRYIASLKKLKKVDNVIYRELYGKVKGGFFRSKRHIELYLEERDILKTQSKPSVSKERGQDKK